MSTTDIPHCTRPSNATAWPGQIVLNAQVKRCTKAQKNVDEAKELKEAQDDVGGASSLASALSTLSSAAVPPHSSSSATPDDEGKTVCNACGLYYKLHGSAHPISMKSDIIRKRSQHDARAQRSSLTEPPSASNTPGTPSVMEETVSECPMLLSHLLFS
ncbi:uncharacterized protein F5147DRAFT_839141 [Suillus discolor]|uniref:GATA-type domain-containing protein n=1 Tax=Suillus discolor TaxID=1912936 RepID=A0A9P7F1C4_9AGAM|nr:uncharacterized protein F5147DRAFT_839141 [Suillus discolor]KAG2100665.1 hypothetical protein F5147DRAFT_839141 [Suillus discolor]